MGILPGGVFGNSKNKIGGLITYVVKGRTIVRSKPATYNDKKSETQTLQRNRMKTVMALARLLLGIIRTSYQTKKTYQSGVNAFISENLKAENFITDTAEFDYGNLVISKGILQPVEISNVVYNDVNGNFTISNVQNANNVTGFDSDLLSVLIIQNTTGMLFSKADVSSRNSSTITVSVPGFADMPSPDFSVFVYAKSDPTTKLKNVSDSVFFGVNS